MGEVAESRKLLREALQHALNNDADAAAPRNLDTLMERFPRLCRKERGAVVQLSNWQADRALRQSHPEFAAFSRQRLTSFLAALD